MNKILNAIKCVNCKNVLNSPVLLPCGHSICKMHATNANQLSIFCNKCGLEHSIPEKADFPTVEALAEIIDAQIGYLDFGKTHREANGTCARLDDCLTKFERILKDPLNITHEAIVTMKNRVQLKGDEAKLKIDNLFDKSFDDESTMQITNDHNNDVRKAEQLDIEFAIGKDLANMLNFNEKEDWFMIKDDESEYIDKCEEKLRIDEKMQYFFVKLDEYDLECKRGLKTSEYVVKTEKIEHELGEIRGNLEKWLKTLDELSLNEREWERIKNEGEKAIESVERQLEQFEIELILQERFDKLLSEIKQEFGKFEINSPELSFILDYRYNSSKPKFDSNILIGSMMRDELYKLCEFDVRNHKLNLLYRGSLHGFSGDDFHSKCDNIPETLTVIKATSGNIFGGYTKATWDEESLYKFDKNAFLFSLVNMEKRPVKVSIAAGEADYAIYCCKRCGPTFGYDINITENFSDLSNFSSFGSSYVLANYPLGSEKAQNFLAGSRTFTVEEIEVYQLVYQQQ